MLLYRRACDMIPLPEDKDLVKELFFLDFDCRPLIAEIEGERFTGCMKTTSAGNKSRSISVLYRGAVVGCAFNSMSVPIPPDSKTSLHMLMNELKNSGTAVSLFPLDKSIVLPLSSLFTGSPVSTDKSKTNIESYEQLVSYLRSTRGSGALCMLGNHLAICLECIYRGEHAAAIFVQEQKLLANSGDLCSAMASRTEFILESCICLPSYGSRPPERYKLSEFLPS